MKTGDQVELEIDISEFAEELINGPGGLKSFEYHEVVTFICERDVAVVQWVIRCLANPKCENSDKVIAAIIENRAKE